jgi:hypoxanthine phosphoribosyltransferase
MDKVKLKSFLSEKEIKEKVKEIGNLITRDFEGEDVLLVGVLKGAWIFLSDLAREIDLNVEISFISVSSYVGKKTVSSGVVRLLCDIDKPLDGRNVIIIEDIVDTGLTLSYLKKLLYVRNPNTIKVCTLLDKPSRRLANITPDYVGFSIPDEFVVGYGLDYDGLYRNLKDICKVNFT